MYGRDESFSVSIFRGQPEGSTFYKVKRDAEGRKKRDAALWFYLVENLDSAI